MNLDKLEINEITDVSLDESDLEKLDVQDSEEVDTEGTKEQGVAEPDNSEDSNKQSFKDDPANKAFAELRREEKRLKERIKELEGKESGNNQKVAEMFSKEYGVNSVEEYFNKVSEQLTNKQKDELKEQASLGDEEAQNKLDELRVQELINKNPLIKEAAELKKKVEHEALNAKLSKELSELKEAYGIEFEDNKTFLESDLYKTVDSHLSKDISLVDAYYLTHKSELNAKNKSVTRQETLNSINGKRHLKTEGGGAGDTDDLSVPAETLQYYIDDGMTKAQAIAHYNKIYK